MSRAATLTGGFFDKLSRILAAASPFSGNIAAGMNSARDILVASVSAAFGWTKSSLQGARRFPEDFICDPFSISGLSEGGFAPCMYHVFPSLPPVTPLASPLERKEGCDLILATMITLPPPVCSSGPGSSPARGEGANGGSRRAPSRLSKIDPAIRLAVSRVFPAQRR